MAIPVANAGVELASGMLDTHCDADLPATSLPGSSVLDLDAVERFSLPSRSCQHEEIPEQSPGASSIPRLLGRPEVLTTLRHTARWVCRRRRIPDEEDDVFQAMALLILQGEWSGGTDPPSVPIESCVALAPFIRRAANKVQDWLQTEQRRKGREVPLEFEATERADRTSYWEVIERLGREIHECIESSVPERRAMLLAFLIENLPMTSIARRMGVPYRRVRATMHKELARLHARFADEVAALD
jgi:DNA-directed RNA polymerase specialized sigma24 family protein